eukprot:gnl/Trimastix_PCT/1353.p1 GENE.gnl/Trimastix_PCT/1353~~gnl/Trimastix_PCT/1353.p1  ORF type:complete len:939 (+),score=369.15 gnl/Trimastix_PCT/1353:128-2944(+)
MDVGKFRSRKAKTAQKAQSKTQFEIMKMLGIPEEEIPRFADAEHWLSYFPPLGQRDLDRFGVHSDWRRTFITTRVNPYYDSFIRWQFQKLRDLGKIKFGKRNTIWSPTDGQGCADHERAQGEGVQPQEYVIIKLDMLDLPPQLESLRGRRVFCGAATLRPETMYGQTNVWVDPNGEYGAFELKDNEVIVCTRRAATNLAYQYKTLEFAQVTQLATLTGQDLIGCRLAAPLTPLEHIRILPMMAVSALKGTGIVTSVPSDAPDDYQALRDLQNKAGLREKFHVDASWVETLEIIPIIEIPGFGDVSAKLVCEQLKVQSQNDRVKLTQAKEQVYKAGFYEGTLIVGPYAGQKVQQVKVIIRDEMLEQGLAMLYSEPENLVISRSGCECVVCLADQWYITYGEDQWKQQATDCLSQLETFSPETRKMFITTLEWLNEWACSRSFGLGSTLPWDDSVLIESLSDSTIYMAYYTIAHMLQGNMEGTVPGTLNIPAEKMTVPVWDAIFLDAPYPEDCGLPAEHIAKMAHEFKYWYPFDLRSSGKELIQNHLTFCLYNHTAIFPQKYWPRGIRTNGHLLMDGQKMAKSLGNFLTLEEAIDRYSSDVVRFALADAGDGLDDANFVDATANAAILRLTKELTWIEEMLASTALRTEGDMTFFDRVFESQINRCIQEADYNFDHMLFREALRCAFFELMDARDNYRHALDMLGQSMRHDLVMRFIEVSALLLSPICPHWSEHVYTTLLEKPTSVIKARWPEVGTVDLCVLMANTYLTDLVSQLRGSLAKVNRPKKGKAAQPAEPQASKTCTVFVCDEYSPWQREVLSIMRSVFTDNTFPADMMQRIKASPALQGPMLKKALPFASFVKADCARRGEAGLDEHRPFRESELIRENTEYLVRSIGLDGVQTEDAMHIQETASEQPKTLPCGLALAKVLQAAPGRPVFHFH